MRLTAIILAAIATLAIMAGIFGYWLGTAFACFDVCPPASTFTPTWLRMIAIFLGPGFILSLAATVFTILAARADGRTTTLIVAIVAPIIAVVALALIMYFFAGSFTPLANSGPPEVAEAARQLSQAWLNGTAYAVIPLVFWPLATFLAVLIRPATS
jgi:hypothetical protein